MILLLKILAALALLGIAVWAVMLAYAIWILLTLGDE